MSGIAKMLLDEFSLSSARRSTQFIIDGLVKSSQKVSLRPTRVISTNPRHFDPLASVISSEGRNLVPLSVHRSPSFVRRRQCSRLTHFSVISTPSPLSF